MIEDDEASEDLVRSNAFRVDDVAISALCMLNAMMLNTSADTISSKNFTHQVIDSGSSEQSLTESCRKRFGNDAFHTQLWDGGTRKKWQFGILGA